jgi:asparagine synthase (glutamine-hydrolysing)
VTQQLQADVPLGAFLSGGVDSSIIVALMQQKASRRVKTFTLGLEEAGFDESPYARAVADHLGTEHTSIYITAAEAREVISQLASMYDEPFADSSQIPTHLVCRAAHRQVIVALSGDAGDELFGGYNRYLWGPRIWTRVEWLPYSLRQVLAAGLQTAAPSTWDRLLKHANVVRPGEKMHKLADALRGAYDMRDLYFNLASAWPEPETLLQGYDSGDSSYSKNAIFEMLPELPVGGMEDPRSRMMFWDALTYLPDDILCKVDRAAMATSLEVRAPFLDHRVAEVAWRLPLSMKLRGKVGKWALRQILYRYVPQELIERPKAGFGIPLGQWLRGPLRLWAEDLLDEGRMLRQGYLNPKPIHRAWVLHLSGQYDFTVRLWSVLMFQAWLEANT